MNPRDSKNTWLTPWACVLGVGASVAAALAQVAPVSAQHIDVLPRLMIAADEPPEVEPAPEPPPAEPAEPAPEPQPEGPTEPLAQPEWDAEPDHPAALEHQAHAVESAPSTTPSPAPAGASRAAAADVPGFQPTMVELGVFGALLYHRLTYNDDLYGFMSPYSLTSAKEFGGYLAIYPLARSHGGFLGRFGVDARYSQMVSFDSLRADGSSFPTRSHEVLIGLRYRVLCERLQARGMDVSLGLGGGGHSFTVDSAIALANVDNRTSVPGREYRFVRADAAARFALDLGFFISMHVGARIITDAGDVDTAAWFPRSRRWGLESGLHVGYVLPHDIEVSAGFEAQRYMYRLRPEPGDPNIVGGLLDRFVHADVTVGWRY